MCRTAQTRATPAARVGFGLLGPLLAGFAAWLRQQKERHPGARLVFLARDMDLVRRLYAQAAPGEEPATCAFSRRSLCPALLQRPLGEAALDLLADALPRQRLTAAQALGYLGFAPGTALPGMADTAAVDLRTRPLPAATRDFLRAAAALGKGPAGQEVRRQARLVRRYLAEQGVGRGPLLLVDIGSGGTTQRISGRTHRLRAARALPCLRCAPAPTSAAGARAGVPVRRPARAAVVLGGQPMLERLISEPCAPPARYAQTPAGVQPQAGETAEAAAGDAPQRRIIEAARRGALDFAGRLARRGLGRRCRRPQTMRPKRCCA